jgi:hypothetical protein
MAQKLALRCSAAHLVMMLVLFAATPARAWGLEEAFLSCRERTSAAERLACYDAIVVRAAASAPAGGASAPVPGDSRFGIENKTLPSVLPFIETSIPGRFEGWSPGDTLLLANGQRWQIIDDSRGFLAVIDPKVRVRRGAMGSFHLEIEGTNRSPRVRRLP